ncbi:phage holin family protein [Microbacterium thalli]|uniref:Phage holin family protein n=1 Tax=Microbacterium thalli TaxID=3027921 RepID=A0ABT5SEU3_9MICO|nr:phage holin family protein [Microbacterium thalli]MDD7928649.1 phage holin family protein [Microbacterium thalli]MDD7961236.1 phage holin family protein [Microbacterium thalli]MDN8549344.1 phage holin family protein [Microbacterium thalli]
MSTPRGFRDRADDSLFTLIGDVPELVRNLVVAEIDSAKTWAKKTGKDAGLGGVWFIVALFFLFWTIPAIGAFAIIGLSSWLPAWASSLIVIGILLVVAVVFAFLGLLRFKRLSSRQTPAQAISTDAKIVKEVADEF